MEKTQENKNDYFFPTLERVKSEGKRVITLDLQSNNESEVFPRFTARRWYVNYIIIRFPRLIIAVFGFSQENYFNLIDFPDYKTPFPPSTKEKKRTTSKAVKK